MVVGGVLDRNENYVVNVVGFVIEFVEKVVSFIDFVFGDNF